MKHFRNLKRYHFLIAVTASTLFLSLLGHAGKNSVYADYSVNILKIPQLAVVFEGIKDGNYPWYVIGGKQKGDSSGTGKAHGKGNNNPNPASGTAIDAENNKGSTEPVASDKDNDTGKNVNTSTSNDTDTYNTGNDDNIGKDSNTGNADTIDNTKDTPDNHSGNTDKNTDNDSSTDKDSTSDAKDELEYETVEMSYFKDALFIGDSRTVGLSEYSGWTEPAYFADVGLTIYDIFDKEIAEVNGKKLTIDKALAKQKYGKIYIMLGINELGTGTTKTFVAAYKKVIEEIQKLQPDAIIYIEGIMNVTKKKSDTDPIFNNKNIKDRNKGIAALADYKTTFYIDVNEVITDKTGGIPEKYTFDSIHLKAAYYKIWTEFLLNHGIVK